MFLLFEGGEEKVVIQIPPAKDYKYRFFGFLVLIVCFGGIGGWSAFAPLESAVVAIGQVRDESNVKVVQHLEGGLVEEIMVKDGDTVRKGQVLLRLNDTVARTRLEELTWQYQTALATMDRLVAERDGLEEIHFSKELQGSEDIIYKMLEGERRLFEFRRESFDSEINILEQRVQQLVRHDRSVQASTASEQPLL